MCRCVCPHPRFNKSMHARDLAKACTLIFSCARTRMLMPAFPKRSARRHKHYSNEHVRARAEAGMCYLCAPLGVLLGALSCLEAFLALRLAMILGLSCLQACPAFKLLLHSGLPYLQACHAFRLATPSGFPCFWACPALRLATLAPLVAGQVCWI